jgi:hypothetical protein
MSKIDLARSFDIAPTAVFQFNGVKKWPKKRSANWNLNDREAFSAPEERPCTHDLFFHNHLCARRY